MLKQKLPIYEHYNGFKNFTYDSIKSCGQENFLGWDTLLFVDQVTAPMLSGNELLFYPKLAKKLKAIPDYPIVSRKYQLPNEILEVKGIEVFSKLAAFAKTCERDFLKEQRKISKKVLKLIEKYSVKPVAPVVADIKAYERWQYHTPTITASGIVWKVLNRYEYDKKPEAAIDLYGLTGYSRDKYILHLETFIKGTSYLGLRIYTSDSYKAKGRLVWFDLNKLEFVKRKQICHLLDGNHDE